MSPFCVDVMSRQGTGCLVLVVACCRWLCRYRYPHCTCRSDVCLSGINHTAFPGRNGWFVFLKTLLCACQLDLNPTLAFFHTTIECACLCCARVASPSVNLQRWVTKSLTFSSFAFCFLCAFPFKYASTTLIETLGPLFVYFRWESTAAAHVC